MIKEFPASQYEYWHSKWVAGEVLSVDCFIGGSNAKCIVRFK